MFEFTRFLAATVTAATEPWRPGPLFTIRNESLIELGQISLRLFYFGKFHSLLTYGCVLWGDGVDSERVFRAQKAADRILNGIERDSDGRPISCRTLFQRFGVLPCHVYTSMNVFVLCLEERTMEEVYIVLKTYTVTIRGMLTPLPFPNTRLHFLVRAFYMLGQSS